jgi:hypothetical protein
MGDRSGEWEIRITTGVVTLCNFDYFQSLFVIATNTSALGTKIDLNVIDTGGTGSY